MKRTLCAVLVLLFLTACAQAATPAPTATPRPAGSLVFDKNFKSPTEQWCRGGSYAYGEFYCQDGEFHAINKGADSIATYNVGNYRNFILQSQMRSLGDAGSYGVVFRGKNSPGARFYIFQVRPTGQYQLIKWAETQSQNQTLIPWTDSDAIKKGQAANLLEVIVQGTKITLFANSEQLANLTDDSFADGSIGPVATEQGHAVASTFKIWELPQ